jgi:hypothetical protein
MVLAWHDWRVVQQVEQLLGLPGEEGLLFAALEDRCQVDGVGLAEFFAGYVRELGFGDERFGLGPDKLLLERGNLCAGRFLVFEFLEFVGDL